MTLAISTKSYIIQEVMGDKLMSCMKTIKQALHAFESHNKPRAISTLYAAYGLLPRSNEGLKIGADIAESLVQLKAYEEALEVIENLENEYGLELLKDDQETRFSFFRAFANACEAHEAMGNKGQACRYRKLALDQLLEMDESVDLEMLQLFS